jgi:hypothetical protein
LAKQDAKNKITAKENEINAQIRDFQSIVNTGSIPQIRLALNSSAFSLVPISERTKAENEIQKIEKEIADAEAETQRIADERDAAAKKARLIEEEEAEARRIANEKKAAARKVRLIEEEEEKARRISQQQTNVQKGTRQPQMGPQARVPPQQEMGPQAGVPPQQEMGPQTRVPPQQEMAPSSLLPPQQEMGPQAGVPPLQEMAPSSLLPPQQEIGPSQMYPLMEESARVQQVSMEEQLKPINARGYEMGEELSEVRPGFPIPPDCVIGTEGCDDEREKIFSLEEEMRRGPQIPRPMQEQRQISIEEEYYLRPKIPGKAMSKIVDDETAIKKGGNIINNQLCMPIINGNGTESDQKKKKKEVKKAIKQDEKMPGSINRTKSTRRPVNINVRYNNNRPMNVNDYGDNNMDISKFIFDGGV